jgi:hypothetical protein
MLQKRKFFIKKVVLIFRPITGLCHLRLLHVGSQCVCHKWGYSGKDPYLWLIFAPAIIKRVGQRKEAARTAGQRGPAAAQPHGNGREALESDGMNPPPPLYGNNGNNGNNG